MPPRINSDHLTGLALVAMLGAGASYWLASVDADRALPGGRLPGDELVRRQPGRHARARSQPSAAALRLLRRPRRRRPSARCSCSVVWPSRVYMSPPVALRAAVGYLMCSVEVVPGHAHPWRRSRSFFKMGPTELRILLAFGTVVLLVHPTAVPIAARRSSCSTWAASLRAVGLLIDVHRVGRAQHEDAVRRPSRSQRTAPLPGRALARPGPRRAEL